MEDFINVLKSDNKHHIILKCIKEIDKDNNGYVTN